MLLSMLLLLLSLAIVHDTRTRPASTIAHATNATNIQPNSHARLPKCYLMRSTSAIVATWRRPAPMPAASSGCGAPWCRWLWRCCCVACDTRRDRKWESRPAAAGCVGRVWCVWGVCVCVCVYAWWRLSNWKCIALSVALKWACDSLGGGIGSDSGTLHSVLSPVYQALCFQ